MQWKKNQGEGKSSQAKGRKSYGERKDSSREVTQLQDCTCCVIGFFFAFFFFFFFVFSCKMGEFGTKLLSLP